MDQQNFHVFISYRREKGFSTAIMIRDRLEQGKKECAGRQTIPQGKGKSEPEL